MSVVAYLALALATNLPDLPLGVPVTAQQVMESGNSGDLLFFVSKTASPWYLLVNPITHISVIVRDKSGKPLSVETHAAEDAPPNFAGDGIHAYPLEARLSQRDMSTGWDMYLVRMNGPRVSAERSSELLSALPALRKQYAYKYTFKGDELRCRATFGRDNVSKTMHCANFASLVLQKLGVARPDQRIDCTRPLDVAWLLLLDGRAYSAKSPIV